MRPHFHLFCQEPPAVSHQTPQKVLILARGELYSNCYMVPEMANKYNYWKVGSMPVLLNERRKSMVGQALIYMQHRHMVCGKLHICHDLDSDQNIYDGAYPTPLLHEALYVNQIMVILGIGWYHNIFSNICVQHQHYPEHNTLCLSILFYWLFLSFPWSMNPCLQS